MAKNQTDSSIAHFPQNLRRIYHQKIARLVKPEGFLVLQGFSKENFKLKQVNPMVGGPNNVDMLFSIDELRDDFIDFKIIDIKKEVTVLREGDFHNAECSVISLIAKKYNRDYLKEGITKNHE